MGSTLGLQGKAVEVPIKDMDFYGRGGSVLSWRKRVIETHFGSKSGVKPDAGRPISSRIRATCKSRSAMWPFLSDW
jgi:hypothetical protein